MTASHPKGPFSLTNELQREFGGEWIELDNVWQGTPEEAKPICALFDQYYAGHKVGETADGRVTISTTSPIGLRQIADQVCDKFLNPENNHRTVQDMLHEGTLVPSKARER